VHLVVGVLPMLSDVVCGARHTQWERIFYLLIVFFEWIFLTVILNFNNIFTYRTLKIPPAQAQCSVFCLNVYVRPDDG
jgi:hypothetical protein